MAPIRRYLRITKYSVLEIRIYLDNPAWAESWLLRRDDPALPRIIAAIRPDVLPKLREENERAKKGKKSKKSGAIRDKVVGDDFEVSLFYTNQISPHSLLTKHKTFADKPRLKSNSSKLTSWLQNGGTSDAPIALQDDTVEDVAPIVIREESDDEMSMRDIPEAVPKDETEAEDDLMFVREDEQSPTPPDSPVDAANGIRDDKKKLAMSTRYEGFSIYGRILCLVIKRTGPGARRGVGPSNAISSQQMMENWVSTQAQRDEEGISGMMDA